MNNSITENIEYTSIVMNNLFYFTSGYLVGYLSNQYKTKILYNAYKQYAIAGNYYNQILEKMTSYTVPYKAKTYKFCITDEEQITYPSDIIDIGMTLDNYTQVIEPLLKKANININIGKQNSNITLSDFCGIYVNKYYYKTNQYYMLTNSVDNIMEKAENEDFILTASLKFNVDGNVTILDITNIMNNMLLFDGYFIFTGALKKIYPELLNYKMPYNCDNVMIEYMSRYDLGLASFREGILTTNENGSLNLYTK